MNIVYTIDERPAISGGFTLAEAMMAMVVLGIAAAGVLVPFSSGARVQAEGIHSTLAAKLASDLMEQILSEDFGQIITKYGTYSEPQGYVISNFYTAEEFTDPMYANLSRGARCEVVDVPISEGIYSTDVEFILATVWVKYNGREIVSIKRLIAK